MPMLSKLGTAAFGGGKRAAATAGIAFAAGVGSTDPVEHALATYEADVMGDSQFSERLLGRQMGGYGLIGTVSPRMAGGGFNPVNAGLAAAGGIGRSSYAGYDLFTNAAQYGVARQRNQGPQAPGSMVFGMFNSRMA